MAVSADVSRHTYTRQDTSSFYGKIDRGEVHARKNFTYQLFRGASIDLSDKDAADDTLNDIKGMPGVKVWPVTVIPRPNDEVIWAGTPNAPELSSLRKREDEYTEDDFSTHVQTQVDMLRAEGLTGKGVKIAVVDTGASLP